jgi:hypothetical protein
MDSDAVVNGDFAPTNGTNASTDMNASQPGEEEIDPIWLSSRTARQIYGLCQVEKVSIRYHPPASHTKRNASFTADCWPLAFFSGSIVFFERISVACFHSPRRPSLY